MSLAFAGYAKEPGLIHFYNGRKVSEGFLQLMKKADKFNESHNYARASLLYQQALRLSPDNAVALHDCAEALTHLGRMNAAFRFYKRLAEIEPNNEDAQFNCAETLFKTGRAAEALPYYKAALTLKPEDAESMFDCSKCLMKLGRPVEALAYCEKAVAIYPEDIQGYLRCAEILIQTNRYADAQNYLEKAIRLPLQGDYEVIWFELSSIYARMGQFDNASRVCEEFLQKFPDVKSVRSEMEDRIALLRENSKTRSDSPIQPAEKGSYINELKVVRWKSIDRLTVYIQSRRDLKTWTPRFNELFRQACSVWERAAGDQLHFQFVDNVRAAQIVCEWSERSSDFRPFAQGVTSHRTGKPTLIRILTVNRSEHSAISDNVMKNVAIHEVGHALGLSGHSGIPKDVMYYCNVSGEISNADKATLWRIYDLKPVKPISKIVPGYKKTKPQLH